MKISKRFDFDAAHFLPHVPDGHKCKRMHGHTYRVEIVCDGMLGQSGAPGMVVDFADLAEWWEPIREALDHRVLNEVPGLGNPTAEHLAIWIRDRLASVGPRPIQSVRVYESSTTWAEAAR